MERAAFALVLLLPGWVMYNTITAVFTILTTFGDANSRPLYLLKIAQQLALFWTGIGCKQFLYFRLSAVRQVGNVICMFGLATLKEGLCLKVQTSHFNDNQAFVPCQAHERIPYLILQIISPMFLFSMAAMYPFSWQKLKRKAVGAAATVMERETTWGVHWLCFDSGIFRRFWWRTGRFS